MVVSIVCLVELNTSVGMVEPILEVLSAMVIGIGLVWVVGLVVTRVMLLFKLVVGNGV